MSRKQDAREAIMVGHRSDGSAVQRPLSPHLQVYDMLQMTSALSISGRITGVVWVGGVLFMVWWLLAAASGADAFGAVQWFASSVIGVIFLFGLTAAAWFHTLNGVRHLAWDAGYGYDIPSTYRSGRWVLVGTALATAATWILATGAWLT
jgi:succinate dehydrogenase / fumarate reductase cytochrome b subunit